MAAVLACIRWNIYDKIVNINGVLAYCIYFPVLVRTGGIYSVNVCLLYVFLLGAVWGNFKYWFLYVITNLIILGLLHWQTTYQPALGSKTYALLIHSFCTIFIGSLFWLIQKKKDSMNIEKKELLNNQVDYLDREVSRRTAELNDMRQTLASDFHDETCNLLSATTQQATLLKMKGHPDRLYAVENILESSRQLYASSKHLLWNLSNDSEDPRLLFQYLTAFGQSFYNGFDISFSAENKISEDIQIARFESFAGINLIFIFKEAMNNVVKHSQGKDVILTLSMSGGKMLFSLKDNGKWKEPDIASAHYGLNNIQRRCKKNLFQYILKIDLDGTRLTIAVTLALQSTRGPIDEN